MFSIIISNLFSYDEGQDLRTILFEERDDVILNGLKLVSKMQSSIKEESHGDSDSYESTEKKKNYFFCKNSCRSRPKQTSNSNILLFCK